MSDRQNAGVARVLDLYCGHGGVGLALDELDVEFVGVDVEDRSDTYPGEFIQADASCPPLDVDADLVWASPPCTAYSDLSPSHYGSREAAMDANPTIPELRVREIAEFGAEYVIENVPGATREGHLDPTARLNGLAFGKSYDLERHFETSFQVPSAVENGQPETTVDTREDQSVAELAAEKGVPASWGKQGVRSAIPREFVHWILHYCPSVDAPRPRREQTLLTDGGRDESSAGTARFQAVDEIVPNGGRGRDGSHHTLGRWTFEYEPARSFVEERLEGRVLNACAGKTKLEHDGEIVRNDLNPERDADLHVDVCEIGDHFVTGEFDAVIFDPPFDDEQAEDKYDGLRADSVLEAFREFAKLVRPNGIVISFGWNSWGMSSIDAFEREETVLLQRGPCLRDVIVTVDRRTNWSIAVKRGGSGE